MFVYLLPGVTDIYSVTTGTTHNTMLISNISISQELVWLIFFITETICTGGTENQGHRYIAG